MFQTSVDVFISLLEQIQALQKLSSVFFFYPLSPQTIKKLAL